MIMIDYTFEIDLYSNPKYQRLHCKAMFEQVLNPDNADINDLEDAKEFTRSLLPEGRLLSHLIMMVEST